MPSVFLYAHARIRNIIACSDMRAARRTGERLPLPDCTRPHKEFRRGIYEIG